MRTRHLISYLALTASLAGCSPAPVPEAPPAPAPAPPPPSAPTVVSPARWLERHVETLEPTASRKLPGSGGVLHGSDAGERWITKATPEAAAPAPDGGASSPRVDTAPYILPERIVGILPLEQRWAFFGSSGRAFIAATPLGAIEEVRTPPAPLRSVGVGSVAVVAATKAGDLLRTTDGGAHWIAAQAPGLSPAVPYALALRADGVGVLLAAPQRALLTTDDGATWAPLAVPAKRAHLVEVSEEGDLWLTNSGWRPERTHRLESQPLAFVAQKASPRQEHSRKDHDAARYENDSDTQRAVSGKRVLSVGRPYSGEPWKIQLSDLDQEGEWKVLPELKDCRGNQVSASAFGGELVLGCVRPQETPPPAGAASKANRFRMVLYRSKDAGASWAEDGEAPLWNTGGKILAGPEGSIVMVRSCGKEAPECTHFALRAAAGQPFSALETPAEITFGAFAIDAARRRLMALGVGGDAKGEAKKVRFYRWSLDGHAGPTTELFPPGSARGAVTVDAQGAIVVVAASKEGWKVLRSADEGATFESQSIPEEIKTKDVALAGERGILADTAGHFWESASSGRTWVRVTGLSRRNGLGAMLCGRDGCAIGAERRLGWDLASATAPAPPMSAPPEAKAPVAGAPPLRCTAGEAKDVHHALVDDLDDLATTGSTGGRLVIPAASKALGLELVLVSASEGHLAAKATGVFDTPPNRAAVGSQTEVLLTSAGVLASRSTYPVDTTGADVWISPVSAEIAWWRPQTGKVLHGRLPPLGKGHMRGTFSLGQRPSDKNDLFWLTADAVIYRPDVARGQDLFTFADKGAPVKITSRALVGARTAVRTSSGLALLDLPSPQHEEAVARFSFANDKGEEPQASWTLAPPSSTPAILPLQRGDEGALVVAWPGPPDGPPRGFLVPVRAADAPADVTDLGLSVLLVDRPRACGEAQDPAAVRIRLDLPRAARRVMLVEGGPKPLLVRAESAVVVVPPQGQPCVTEWIARGGEGSELAIVPVAAPQQAWAISATPTDWQDGVRSRELTVRALRCEEAPGLQIPASFGWKGF